MLRMLGRHVNGFVPESPCNPALQLPERGLRSDKELSFWSSALLLSECCFLALAKVARPG